MILHRLGHSEIYGFSLELETALAKAIDEVFTYLSPQIVTGEGNLVFHCGCDNLNKTTAYVHGSNIISNAEGGGWVWCRQGNLVQDPNGKKDVYHQQITIA